MEFFDKLAIALVVWAAILLLAADLMWPTQSWHDKKMIKPAKCALRSGFACALAGTLVAVFA